MPGVIVRLALLAVGLAMVIATVQLLLVPKYAGPSYVIVTSGALAAALLGGIATHRASRALASTVARLAISALGGACVAMLSVLIALFVIVNVRGT